jgi:hypothetical protein
MNTVPNENQKAMLENMARTWESLAVERENLIQQSKRIADLEIIRQVSTGRLNRQPADQAGDDSRARRQRRT